MEMNEKELRKAIERKCGPLTNDQWEKIILNRSPANYYNETDLKEKLEKAQQIVELPRTITRAAKLSITLPASHRQLSESVADKFKERAKKLQVFLGLKNPLKFKNLAAWLTHQVKKLDTSKDQVELNYPNEDNTEVRYICFNKTEEKLMAIKGEAEKIRRLTPWEEDETVAFLLCGTIPLLPYITVTQHYQFGGHEYGRRPGLIIKVHDLNISAEVIRRVYVHARADMFRDIYPDSKTTTFRPRNQAPKTTKLLKFRAENKELAWEECFKRWNSSRDDPKDKYATARSMATSLYKARKK